MKKSSSKRKLLILDCCYAGAFELGTKAGGSKGVGQEVLSACGATQLSWEGDKITEDTDKSLFTHYLIEGLKTGKAAPDKEEITVEQLYQYVHDQVIDKTPKMKPERSVSRGGSWDDRPNGLRSANRYGDYPVYRSHDYGFRLSRTLK